MGCEWIGYCALGPEAQAAWAQAVLSVAAIAVAIWLPRRDRRLETRRKLDIYCALLKQLHEVGLSDVHRMTMAIGLSAQASHDPRWVRAVQAVDAIQLHDVEDHRLIPLLSEAVESAREATSAWVDGEDMNTQPSIRNQALGKIGNAVSKIGTLHGEAVAIRRDISSATWWKRLLG